MVSYQPKTEKYYLQFLSFFRSTNSNPHLALWTCRLTLCHWGSRLTNMLHWTRASLIPPWALCILMWGKKRYLYPFGNSWLSAIYILIKKFLMNRYKGNLSSSHRLFSWKFVQGEIILFSIRSGNYDVEGWWYLIIIKRI